MRKKSEAGRGGGQELHGRQVSTYTHTQARTDALSRLPFSRVDRRKVTLKNNKKKREADHTNNDENRERRSNSEEQKHVVDSLSFSHTSLPVHLRHQTQREREEGKGGGKGVRSTNEI